MTIQIWNFPKGLRGVRVAWLCEEMGLPYEVHTVGYPVPADYRVRNPLGTVPYMQDDTAGLTESTAILLYLAETYGPTPLLPPVGDPFHGRVLQMTALSEATLGALLNALLVDRFAVPEAERGGALSRRLRTRVEEVLAFIDKSLRLYVAGNVFTIADIAVATALELWTGPLKGELSIPLTEYHGRVTNSEAYRRAVKACG